MAQHQIVQAGTNWFWIKTPTSPEGGSQAVSAAQASMAAALALMRADILTQTGYNEVMVG